MFLKIVIERQTFFKLSFHSGRVLDNICCAQPLSIVCPVFSCISG